MNKLIPLLICLLPIPSFAATTLATVNGKVITLEEFNKRYRDNLKFFQVRKPTKQDVLEEIIKREIGIQEARKKGLDKDPLVIERMNSVLYQALIEKQLSKQFEKIVISDGAAKKYYSKNPEIRTSHIFVAVPPGSPQKKDREAYKRIKEVYDKHVKPRKGSFSQLAQRFSEDRSAPMGGDIDYQTKDGLDPAYYAAAIRLKRPGRVSGVVKSAFGYHIIKLTGKRKWKDVDQPKIKRLAFEERRQAIFDRYITSLRKRAKVSVNKKLLN